MCGNSLIVMFPPIEQDGRSKAKALHKEEPQVSQKSSKPQGW